MSEFPKQDLSREPFGKLYAKMFTGSLMGKGPHVISVMSYAVAHAKPPDGLVEMNPKLLSVQIGDTLERIEEAIKFLEAEDPESRSPDEGGKRLVRVGGFKYKLVTWRAHRDGTDYEARRQYWKEKQQERREKDKVSVAEKTVQQPDASKDKIKPTVVTKEPELSPFETFWKAYPRKVAKTHAEKMFSKVGGASVLSRILAALKWQCETEDWLKEDGKYIPHPATYLNRGMWQDEPPPGMVVKDDKPKELTPEQIDKILNHPPRLSEFPGNPKSYYSHYNLWQDQRAKYMQTRGIPFTPPQKIEPAPGGKQWVEILMGPIIAPKPNQPKEHV